MKCPKCNGKKKVVLMKTGPFDIEDWCNFCNGKKDLDWIENILGVTPIAGIWNPVAGINRGKIKDEMSNLLR